MIDHKPPRTARTPYQKKALALADTLPSANEIPNALYGSSVEDQVFGTNMVQLHVSKVQPGVHPVLNTGSIAGAP